ncbi:Signal transduction histidine-protein kinase ArlS [Streptomyces sp. YIM 121038]|uniref:sensor histidine kinase n=1 Tax=unclassified Streptomyces TaxID=2593676 RepID=UPI001110B750|nr:MULTISPECIES: ATP-binding protein [unclassified Streptomyces]QCX74850.1 Signal transduction histidine-protein kinase ArlS [Streptomyces sp. YIM 121038]
MRLTAPSAPPVSAVFRRLLPKRVRMRLTLLYGVLFVVSGAVLLAITYLLVTHASTSVVLGREGDGPVLGRADGASGPLGLTGGRLPLPLKDGTRALREHAYRQHQQDLRSLVVQSGIALAIMAVLSIALGWLVAGRVLRPLRTMTGTIRRISARNVHERLAVAGPADELKDLADTVDGLLGRLETALDAHKRFVANAAHELRTPLTLEHALVEESLMDREATVESYRSNLERLLTISEQQARLLESLLTLSSSERGLDRREPLDLADVAEQTVRVPRPDAARHRLRITTSTAPAPLAGDSALVQRLVANLVDNAVGYNVPGGHVRISTGTEDGRALVTVVNSGPRVPPEQVERLFEPFQRLGRTADEGHHGLGLSIVRTIATAHDALLSASARPGGGLVVAVAFPARAEPASPAPRHDPTAAR